MRAKMKRRSEGKQVDKKRNILRGNISSNFDTVTLWIESTQRQLDIYKEELRQAREEIDKLRSMYMDFYEFAQVGYLTLDRKGRIKGANLMAASLLGIGRSRLLQNALLAYLLKEDWLVFQASLKRIIETPEGQTCEVRVKRKTGDPLWVSVRGGESARPSWRIARDSAGFVRYYGP